MARLLTLVVCGLLVSARFVHCEEDAGANAGASGPLAGFQPASDVEEHSKIDLDIKDIEAANNEDPPDYTASKNIYENGRNSASGDALRALKSFSTKYTSASYQTEPFAIAANNFWGDWDYADKHLVAAFDGADLQGYGQYGTGTLGSTDNARKQIIKKVIKFQLVFQYAVHELESALKKYNDASATDVDRYGLGGSVHALDEWWAFHVGSLENGATSGYGPYILYEKRSKKFGTNTCTGFNTGGESCANKQLLESTNELKELTQSAGNAATVEAHAKCIRATLKIGPVQGCLEYGYKASVASAEDLPAWKAEAWAFCGAALPFLHAVDAAAAERVRAEVTLDSDKAPKWAVVKAAFTADNINKMGMRCADIGAYETAEAQHSVCTDTATIANTDGSVIDCPVIQDSDSESAANLRSAGVMAAVLSAAVAATFAI